MSAAEENNQGVDVPSPHPSLICGGAGVELDRHALYYYLHAEERRAKQREKYNSDPEVIRKRQEREAKKAAKEAEKEAEKLAQKKIKEEQKKLKAENLQKIALEVLEKRKSPA